MAEDVGLEADGVEADAPLDTNSIGVTLALDGAREDPSLRDDVADFLKDQRSLIEVQKHHLARSKPMTGP
jgi:hypothetical protein